MHVGIADHDGKHEAADKLRDGILARFGPQDGCDIGIAVVLVLVGRILPEHLREILHVDGRSPGRAVEALYGEGFGLRRARLFGKSLDLRHIDEAVVRHHDADAGAPVRASRIRSQERRRSGRRAA